MIYLKEYIVDYGWPDPGHTEWALVYGVPRKNRILQFFLGNKEDYLVFYGDSRPTKEKVKQDTELWTKKRAS